jgi:Cu/Ag efflux protein CusF
MKRSAMTGFVLSPFIAATAHGQSGGMKGMEMKDMPMKGMDMKTDKKGEPVRTMDWPSMTMAFKVMDKALMDKLTKDKKVDFEFRQEGRDYIVTGVK